MTDENTTSPPDYEQHARERATLLHNIWMSQARAVARILENTPPEKLKASMLQSINQFLRLNDVSSGTLDDEGKEKKIAQDLSQQLRALAPIEEDYANDTELAMEGEEARDF